MFLVTPKMLKASYVSMVFAIDASLNQKSGTLGEKAVESCISDSKVRSAAYDLVFDVPDAPNTMVAVYARPYGYSATIVSGMHSGIETVEFKHFKTEQRLRRAILNRCTVDFDCPVEKTDYLQGVARATKMVKERMR